jgi:hypothetical protein
MHSLCGSAKHYDGNHLHAGCKMAASDDHSMATAVTIQSVVQHDLLKQQLPDGCLALPQE